MNGLILVVMHMEGRSEEIGRGYAPNMPQVGETVKRKGTAFTVTQRLKVETPEGAMVEIWVRPAEARAGTGWRSGWRRGLPQ